MITPLQVLRAKRTWRVGWFVAWTRLRARRAYWAPPALEREYRPLVEPRRNLAPRH